MEQASTFTMLRFTLSKHWLDYKFYCPPNLISKVLSTCSSYWFKLEHGSALQKIKISHCHDNIHVIKKKKTYHHNKNDPTSKINKWLFFYKTDFGNREYKLHSLLCFELSVFMSSIYSPQNYITVNFLFLAIPSWSRLEALCNYMDILGDVAVLKYM